MLKNNSMRNQNVLSRITYSQKVKDKIIIWILPIQGKITHEFHYNCNKNRKTILIRETKYLLAKISKIGIICFYSDYISQFTPNALSPCCVDIKDWSIPHLGTWLNEEFQPGAVHLYRFADVLPSKPRYEPITITWEKFSPVNRSELPVRYRRAGIPLNQAENSPCNCIQPRLKPEFLFIPSLIFI